MSHWIQQLTCTNVTMMPHYPLLYYYYYYYYYIYMFIIIVVVIIICERALLVVFALERWWEVCHETFIPILLLRKLICCTEPHSNLNSTGLSANLPEQPYPVHTARYLGTSVAHSEGRHQLWEFVIFSVQPSSIPACEDSHQGHADLPVA